MKSLNWAVLACVTALCAPVLHAEETRPTCPNGMVGDWEWQADYSYIKMRNQTQALSWTSIGSPASTTGLNIDVFVTEAGENVRSISFKMLAPNFTLPVGSEGELVSMFDHAERFEPHEEGKPRKLDHDYAIVGVDSSGPQQVSVFSAGANQWEKVSSKDTISGLWIQRGPETLGWGVADQTALSFLIATQIFKPFDNYGNREGWDNIAVSNSIDLTVLKSVLEVARPAQKDWVAQNTQCNWIKWD